MKKFLMIALVLIMVTVLAACGQNESSSNGGSDDSDSKEDTPKKEEKLTAQDVITKSGETMQDWKGMHYVLDGEQVINASKGEEKQKIDQSFSLESEMTMDPMTMHMNGSMKIQGQEAPLENYYLDGKMYTKTPQGQWIAIEGMDLDQLQKQTQGQDPSQSMDQFNEMIDALSADENAKDAITMEETDDMYVVTMKLDEEQSSKITDIIKEQTKSVMEQIEKMGVPNVMENMKLKGLNQSFYIDKESFEQQKMEQQMTMEMTKDGATMTIDMDNNIEIKGEVKEKITVPEDIKNNAQVVTMEQLQQAQQAQQTQQ